LLNYNLGTLAGKFHKLKRKASETPKLPYDITIKALDSVGQCVVHVRLLL
jgi:hypothetical protein